jgi:tetratricopeptide (TPR) repeat protein
MRVYNRFSFIPVLVSVICGTLAVATISCKNKEQEELDIESHLARAGNLSEAGNYQAALAEWRVADQMRPNQSETWVSRSWIESKAGNQVSAMDAAGKAISFAKPPELPPYSFTVGLLLKYDHDNEAEKLIDEAIQDPRLTNVPIPFSRLLRCKIDLYMKTGRAKNAIPICNQALALSATDDPELYKQILALKSECETSK